MGSSQAFLSDQVRAAACIPMMAQLASVEESIQRRLANAFFYDRSLWDMHARVNVPHRHIPSVDSLLGAAEDIKATWENNNGVPAPVAAYVFHTIPAR